MTHKIGIIGLGYVGLPLAIAFAKKFPGTLGFDTNARKVADLKRGIDVTHEVSESDLKATSLQCTTDEKALSACTFIVVAVPPPVDKNRRPDLTPLQKASETLGRVISKGTIISFESTVYPGVTEEYCGPIIEQVSGLRRGRDFKLAYSPERVNPGDKEHTIERIVKVVSGEDAATLETVAQVYGAVVTAGVFRATSIKVAEAAKVIENTQRDLNIALMNELAIIFDRMGIVTRDVLAAAGTKWNFLKFVPGLVGGHCIGVDPYYLTFKAEELGYHPDVILAGRRINDGMGAYVAQRAVKMLANQGFAIKGAKVAVLGLTFKEDVPDIRNSRVPDIIQELRQFGIEPVVADPFAEAHEVHEEYGLTLTRFEEIGQQDAVILAVAHKQYMQIPREQLMGLVKPGGVLVDVKAVLSRGTVRSDLAFWSL